MKIMLGVIDVPYFHESSIKEVKFTTKAGKAVKFDAQAGNQTTGDVAQLLEDKYHVMEHFWELHGDEVVARLEDSLLDTIEALGLGAPSTLDPFGDAFQEGERLFRKMIDSQELDGLGYPGIPTQAALEGRSSRFKDGDKERDPRPSFRDTGTYEQNFKMWVEDDTSSGHEINYLIK